MGVGKAGRLGIRVAVAVALVAGALGVLEPGASAETTIALRGPAFRVSWVSDSTKSLVLRPPAGTNGGDVLVAELGFGRTNAHSQPALSAPAGWTLVSRTNQGTKGALAVFTHTYAAGETSYRFTTNVKVGGVGFVLAFGGVDRARPVDVVGGQVSTSTTSVVAPSVTTTASDEMLVAGYYGTRTGTSSMTWTPPGTMTEQGETGTTSSRSGMIATAPQAPSGATGTRTAVTSSRVDAGIAALLALRPATATTTAPVITALAASGVTTTGATVTWRTDQPADSQVDYGTSTQYGSSTPRDPALVTNHSVALSGLAPDTQYVVRVRSANSAGQTSTATGLSFRTAALPPPTGGAVPLLLETDMFSNADDVGALATAFGLQLRGEARVIGIGVNTRTSRPSVATNSWRCVAAIAQWYGFGSVPIGTALPNDGTATASIDFIRPCAERASGSTPTPGSAVTMYRRALAAEADNSVVIASFGYLGNLAALLDSPADGISALSGRDLVARKVQRLVIMGGHYPSGSPETNLAGDVASAQRVATGWPTKVVWSGSEVGDEVRTGDTITQVHPTTSPVRIAYEAFVGPNKWIYSYDLTAVYHAVRAADGDLSEVGPGTNVVDSSGGNRFTTGSGNHWYLRLGDEDRLEDSIEALLDVLPGSSPPLPSTSEPTDDFDTNTLDPTRWTTGGTGSSVRAANQQLEITHAAGAWTNGSLESNPFDATGRSIRVRVRRAAGYGVTGSTFGESSVRLQVDGDHWVEFFIGKSISAWADTGSGPVNLTPSWPSYSPTTMQWLRYREAGGRLYFEYAAGTTSPGTWTVLASTPDPFPLASVRFRVIAGANTTTDDVAQFDDVLLE